VSRTAVNVVVEKLAARGVCWRTRQYVEAWCAEHGGACPHCGLPPREHYPAPVGLPPEIYKHPRFVVWARRREERRAVRAEGKDPNLPPPDAPLFRLPDVDYGLREGDRPSSEETTA